MFTLLGLLTFFLSFGTLYSMKTQKTTQTQEVPVRIQDTSWNYILPILPTLPNIYIGNLEDCRHCLSTLVWITKEGATWRALRKVYRYWNTIYHWFGRWCDARGFEKLHEHFHVAGEILVLLMDSTIVCAHTSAAGAPKKSGCQLNEAPRAERW